MSWLWGKGSKKEEDEDGEYEYYYSYGDSESDDGSYTGSYDEDDGGADSNSLPPEAARNEANTKRAPTKENGAANGGTYANVNANVVAEGASTADARDDVNATMNGTEDKFILDAAPVSAAANAGASADISAEQPNEENEDDNESTATGAATGTANGDDQSEPAKEPLTNGDSNDNVNDTAQEQQSGDHASVQASNSDGSDSSFVVVQEKSNGDHGQTLHNSSNGHVHSHDGKEEHRLQTEVQEPMPQEPQSEDTDDAASQNTATETLKETDVAAEGDRDLAAKTQCTSHTITTDNIRGEANEDHQEDAVVDKPSTESAQEENSKIEDEESVDANAEEQEGDEKYAETDDEDADEDTIDDNSNDNGDNSNNNGETNGEEPSEEDSEEEEETTLAEKQSLLILAAEHDRVDILKSILSDDASNEDRQVLLKPSFNIPPLHIAISFGSVNATQSLLRIGADPSIRPDVPQIQHIQKQRQQESAAGANETEFVQISNMGRFDGISAWELAFGRGDYESLPTGKRGWSLFGSSPSKASQQQPSSEDAKQYSAATKPIRPIDMAEPKRNGIKHAFTAEALRCVGADELHRLQQLLNSGMPSSIEIGGRSLVLWAKELGAMECHKCLAPEDYIAKDISGDAVVVQSDEDGTGAVSSATDDSIHKDGETPVNTGEQQQQANGEAKSKMAAGKSSVETKEDSSSHGRDPSTSTAASSSSMTPMTLKQQRPAGTVQVLANRCDELESLAEALALCLDNLAEEVSVCQSLLSQGGGTALAMHVKSLKNIQDDKEAELEALAADFEENQEELDLLLEEAEEIGWDTERLFPSLWTSNGGVGSKTSTRYNSLIAQISALEESEQREKLDAYIAASESKVRKLRSSIAELTEDSTKDLEEVEYRGLIGGINLVRSIRERVRDIEYQLSETKTWNLECQAKIDIVQSRLEEEDLKQLANGDLQTTEDNDANHEMNHVGNGHVEHAVGEQEAKLNGIKQALDKSSHSHSSVRNDTTPNGHERGLSPRSPMVSPVRAPDRVTIPGRIVNPFQTSRHPAVEDEKNSDDDDANDKAGDDNLNTDEAAATTTADADESAEMKPSEQIATGESRALVVRNPGGNRAYLTLSIWKVLLRIMGLRQDKVLMKTKASAEPANLMVV